VFIRFPRIRKRGQFQYTDEESHEDIRHQEYYGANDYLCGNSGMVGFIVERVEIDSVIGTLRHFVSRTMGSSRARIQIRGVYGSTL